MKKLLILVAITVALASVTCGCKTPRLEPGGVYAPTNAVGEVVYSDAGLALADASYKFAYETMFAVFKFERDNRVELFKLSPNIKLELDKLRPQVVDIDKRWAASRKLYKANPTPAGLNTVQTILAEIQRILPVVQAQLNPVSVTLTKKVQ